MVTERTKKANNPAKTEVISLKAVSAYAVGEHHSLILIIVYHKYKSKINSFESAGYSNSYAPFAKK